MKTTKMFTILVLALTVVFWQAEAGGAEPMGTAWTYQGRFLDANGPPDGLYDFQFKLFDDSNTITGNQLGSTVDVNDLDVINGYFTVVLDLGSDVFNGDARWLEIDVRQADSNDPNDFITLKPRQKVTPTPYALQTRGIFVDDSGNVGVGTKFPNKKLTVAEGGFAVYPGQEASIITDGFNVKLGDPEGARNQVYFEIDDFTEKFVFNNGNVGIGTSSPGSRLDIKAASGYSDGGLRVTSSINNNRVITLQDATPGDQGQVSVRAGGSDKVVLRANGDTYFNGGNVGIGKASPSQRLDVAGNAVFSGRVGIGTTSPVAELEVRSSSTNSDVIKVRASDGSELFNVREDASGDGMVHVRDRAGAEKIRLSSYGYSILKGGNVGIGDVGVPLKKLVVRGNILVKSESTGADVLELGQGLDYAEGFNVTENVGIEPGTVLVIDSENPGKLKVGQTAYDSKVAGIVAGANGVSSGARLGVGQFDYDVALAGRVYCKVDATEEAVHAGDQLTTSGIAGHAMKATDYDRARGAVLGKAMESLAKGQKAKILVLVTLQ